MTEEQIIEIAEKIEEMYADVDPDVWYRICEVLVQRADWKELRYNNSMKKKATKKVDKKKIINELNAAAERLQRKRHQSILDHGGTPRV